MKKLIFIILLLTIIFVIGCSNSPKVLRIEQSFFVLYDYNLDDYSFQKNEFELTLTDKKTGVVYHHPLGQITTWYIIGE
jgi:uncharacterized protein YcfL